MTLVVVGIESLRVFRILHPMLSVVGDHLRSMGFNPLANQQTIDA